MLEIISYVGSFLILLAFGLNLAQRLHVWDYRYLFLNIVGCSMTSIYCYSSEAWAILALQLAWLIVAAYRVVWRLYKDNADRMID